jgi:hypothetical protein
MTKSPLFASGIPTEADVHRLFAAFGVPAEGVKMTYTEVSEVIHVSPVMSRFRTVTSAWRNRLVREHNIYLRAGEGAYVALAPGERVDLSATKLRMGVRSFRRAHAVATSTDWTRLSVEERQQAEHVQRVATTVIQSARLQARTTHPVLPLAVGTPTPS